MGKLKNRIGEIGYNTQKEKIIIIEYEGKDNITVEFEGGYKTKSSYKDFKNGNIKNPYTPNVYDIGYTGEGLYKSRYNGIRKNTKQYDNWLRMLQRCYDDKYKEKYNTYIYCTVCAEWHNFQNFAKWYDKNYYTVGDEKMCLDKDILIKGNKIYSPENCVFVPQRINKLFTKSDKSRGEYPIGVCLEKTTNKYMSFCSIINNDNKKKQEYLGVYLSPEDAFYKGYKPFKEKVIKQVAEEYKDRIPNKLYDAMYEYQVEIDD